VIDYPIRQLVLCEKDIYWLDGSLVVEPRSVGIILADGLYDIGGKPLQLKTSMIGESGLYHFLNYTLSFALQLRKSTENLSQDS
jgi:hypothetical protein